MSTTGRATESSTSTDHQTTKSELPTTVIVEEPTTTTTTTERYTDPPRYNQKFTPPTSYDDRLNKIYPTDQKKRRPERVSSETSEVVALIIGIIAGALIAVILIILAILKFKGRSDRSFKVDDSKGSYQQGPSAALLANSGSTNGHQAQYQLNGALRNGDKLNNFQQQQQMQQQKSKKRDSKDIKEWYV